MVDSDPKELIRTLTEESPLKAERIHAGRNSRVFRVDCDYGQSLLAKFYIQPTADGRSRLKQEWSALLFMTESGIKNIPRPIGFDETLQGAVYSFIPGSPVSEISKQDIFEVIKFLAKLKKISNLPQAVKLPPAAEACFSPATLVENIRQRLNKLRALPANDEPYLRMHSFLEGQFCSEFEKCISNAKHNFPGESWKEVLPQKFKTLSPSDFGFHNALRTDNGLAFVDFEYFGWDDPVKMASDFLLHPAMNLNMLQMQTFFSAMAGIFGDDGHFMLRFRTYLPLFRLKWCIIMLNEFINQHIKRREFAEGEVQRTGLRARQLEKAENFLNKDKDILTALNLRN